MDLLVAEPLEPEVLRWLEQRHEVFHAPRLAQDARVLADLLPLHPDLPDRLRRIELAWPVTEPQLKARIIDECLLAYLYDEALSWQMRPDGSYEVIGMGQSESKGLKKGVVVNIEATVQSIQRALESSMEAEWQANLPNQALLLGSKDHREGLAATRDKRAPNFIGR